jgi:hypothetical protein
MKERTTWRKQGEEGWKPGAKRAAGLLGGKVGERPWRRIGMDIEETKGREETIGRSARFEKTAQAIVDRKDKVGKTG